MGYYGPCNVQILFRVISCTYHRVPCNSKTVFIRRKVKFGFRDTSTTYISGTFDFAMFKIILGSFFFFLVYLCQNVL